MKTPPRRKGSRFGYPDMNPATLLFITQELRRARTKHPNNEKNFGLISHYHGQLDRALYDYAAGQGNAAQVFTTGLQIAVMAIRLVEEGIAGNPYRGNAPDIGGPLGSYNPENETLCKSGMMTKDALDKLTERFTRK